MDIVDLSDEELKNIIRRAKEIFPDPYDPIKFGSYVHEELEILILSKNAINITPEQENERIM